MRAAAEPILAITGLGAVSAAGAGVAALRATLAASTSHIAELPDAIAAGLPGGAGALFAGVAGGEVGAVDRVFAATDAVVREAVAQAGLATDARCGLALGTALGAVEHAEAAARDPGGAPDVAEARLHRLTERVASARSLDGPRSTFSATCVSALYALEQARLELVAGRADAMVCVGVDSLSRFMQAGFCALGAVGGAESVLGERTGLVLGEAAAAVVLEPLSRALERGARPLAVLAGVGRCADTTHLTSPDEHGTGMTAAVAACLAEADRAAADVGWVGLTAAESPKYARMYDHVLAAAFDGLAAERVTWEDSIGHVLAATGAMGLVHGALLLAEHPGARDVLTLTVGFGGQNGATLLASPSRFAPAAATPRAPTRPARREVLLVAQGVSTAAPRELEEGFPGRWNPRRAMRPEIAPLVDAAGRAMGAAGWWTRGRGEAVAGGQVVATDLHATRSLDAFAADLERGGFAATKPSDFLFALPSSAAALVGAAYGLERYQATLQMHGLAGFQAVAHAIELLRAGRLDRMLVGALSVVDPSARGRWAPDLGAAEAERSAEDARFALAVVWCLAVGEADAMPHAAGILDCAIALGEECTPDPEVIESAELLAGMPGQARHLCAPSMLAAGRALERAPAGGELRVRHVDPSFGGVGTMLIRAARGGEGNT